MFSTGPPAGCCPSATPRTAGRWRPATATAPSGCGSRPASRTHPAREDGGSGLRLPRTARPATAYYEDKFRCGYGHRQGSSHVRGHTAAVACSRFHDGSCLASGSADKTVRLWDGDGEELRRLADHQAEVTALAFARRQAFRRRFVGRGSTCGREHGAMVRLRGTLVNSVGFTSDGKPWSPQALTGRSASGVGTGEVGRLERPPISVGSTPRHLAGRPVHRLSGAGQGRAVWRWPAVRGRPLTGHRGRPAVQFSPDGRTVASGGADTTTLIWDVTGRMKAGRWQPARLTPKELEARWVLLAGPDAAAAHRALWELVAAPQQSVPFLEEPLRSRLRMDARSSSGSPSWTMSSTRSVRRQWRSWCGSVRPQSRR
jgi:hypothetical protein